MSKQTMTIREMCEAFDVTPRALRFYEAKELLSPIRQGQKRLFTRRDRARLKLVLRGKRYGVPLEDIRRLLDIYETEGGEAAQLRQVLDCARKRLNELLDERAAIDATIAALQGEIAGFEALPGNPGASAA